MTKSDEQRQREERLAAKLRENLRRRKTQARARAGGTARPAPVQGPAGNSGGKPST
jgi:hypothetical protein